MISEESPETNIAIKAGIIKTNTFKGIFFRRVIFTLFSELILLQKIDVPWHSFFNAIRDFEFREVSQSNFSF
jgi:hypothetical protein